MARRRLYANSRRTEPDMRTELNNMFDGIYPEIAKKMSIVLRKMKRQNGELIQCACVSKLTKEPDKDTFCPLCHGEGYYWEETWIDCYKVQIKSEVGNALKERLLAPGLQNTPLVIFYTRSSVEVTEDDKIVEVFLDTEGDPVQPVRRKKLYRIGSAVDLRADNAKLEYWKLDCFEETRKHLNGDC